MEVQAERLAEFVRERVGDAVRAVGYHTSGEIDVVYVRDDVAKQYPPERVERFASVSRGINDDLSRLDEMGRPKSSLHSLEEGFILQFHEGAGDVVFLAMDREVGRNLTRFIDECREQMR
ncbi:DUF7522 family protein [Halospeciosus flavus]|uniref:Roadblock/LAMTOR2 domain-containing protein n=1 Tax=Halospeciosus flavus TaxID=3032283 RepID=A0ABD5Z5W7_9EURY|nr:hypothetical protein [Halospeciosus flavus]